MQAEIFIKKFLAFIRKFLIISIKELARYQYRIPILNIEQSIFVDLSIFI